MAENQAPATVPMPEGAVEQAAVAPPTVAIPEGASLGAPTQTNANVGGGAPLTEQDAKQDQANPGGSYAATQARLGNAPAKDPDHVRFKASDGSIHDVPKEHLTKAVQIDPKLQVIDWPTVPMSKVGRAAAQLRENIEHPDTKAMDAYAHMGEEEEQKTGAGPAAKAMLVAGSGGLAADAIGAGGVVGAIGKTLAEGAGSAAGDAAGQVIDKGEIDPTEVAVSGALGAGGRAIGETAGGVKSLISGGGKDVTEQGLKDMIKTASGAKDPDVIDTIHSVVDKPKMFSTVENELKLAKPKLEDMKDAANAELEDLRKNSAGTVAGAKQTAHQMFDDLVTKAKGSLKEDQVTQGIHDVRDFVTSKLKNEDMKFSDLNDVKRAIADEIKKFDSTPNAPQVVNTLDKSQQEALKKARNLLETIEQQAEPASKAVNKRLSTLIDTTQALDKKFPHLDDATKAKASYEAGKTEAKKNAVNKVGGAVIGGGAGAAATLGGKAIIENLLKP